MPDTTEVVRDRWGVPHIRASNEDALFFANGYVHAQDRLWQMDAARRRAIGRYAEWMGKEACASDILARKLGVEQASRRDYAALSTETKRMLERYADGVNAAIEALPHPVEYVLLKETPEPWEPWHSVAVMRQRGLLMGSIWFKLWRAAAVRTIGAEGCNLLRYEDGEVERFVLPQGDSDSRRWIAGLDALAPAIKEILSVSPTDATIAGSNNWALAGSRTESGRPIISGDPHRAYEIPSMYAQLHLTCDAFDALGFSVPGVPAFPHFCHTERVAWCVTHAFADIHDLYLERFDPADPTRYAVETGWAQAEVRQETVRVRGEQDVDVTVFQTRHGPVIVGDPKDGYGVALRSVQLDPLDRSLDCLLPMLRAGSVQALNEAGRNWGVIDHSVVSADVDGQISVNVRAIVPKRSRINGWLPVPGWTGQYEWEGFIPWERMPRIVNPRAGMLVTANNRITPDDDGDYLCTDCHPSTRARRIAERLDATPRATLADMEALLGDTSSARAREIVARIMAAGVDVPGAGALLAILGKWDGDMAVDKTAPSVYYLVRQEMTRILARKSGLNRAVDDYFAQIAAPGVVPLNQLWWTLPELLRRDDTTLLGGLSWNQVIGEALETVSAHQNIAPWGALHRPTFAHPLAGQFPDRAADLAPTSQEVAGDGDCVCANGAYPTGGPAATYGPVARYAFDVGDWDNSRWVVFHGTSGLPGDAHYSDQNPFWAKGELVPAPFTREAVDRHAVSRQKLVVPPRTV